MVPAKESRLGYYTEIIKRKIYNTAKSVDNRIIVEEKKEQEGKASMVEQKKIADIEITKVSNGKKRKLETGETIKESTTKISRFANNQEVTDNKIKKMSDNLKEQESKGTVSNSIYTSSLSSNSKRTIESISKENTNFKEKQDSEESWYKRYQN